MLNSISARSEFDRFRTVNRILEISHSKSENESYKDNELNKRSRSVWAWGICYGTKLDIFV